jgi:hypothetical protein
MVEVIAPFIVPKVVNILPRIIHHAWKQLLGIGGHEALGVRKHILLQILGTAISSLTKLKNERDKC